MDDDHTSPTVMIDRCTGGKQSVRTFNSTAADCFTVTFRTVPWNIEFFREAGRSVVHLSRKDSIEAHHFDAKN